MLSGVMVQELWQTHMLYHAQETSRGTLTRFGDLVEQLLSQVLRENVIGGGHQNALECSMKVMVPAIPDFSLLTNLVTSSSIELSVIYSRESPGMGANVTVRLLLGASVQEKSLWK